MQPVIRKATPEDAALILRVIDMASDGFVPALLREMAPDGMDGSEFGLALVRAEEGEFSYRHGWVCVQGGLPLGGMIGYPLPTTPEPAELDVPDALLALKELENLVPGYWYINFVALSRDSRGQGLGTALLDEAESQAHECGCPGLALVVVASNVGAIHAYERAGYLEKARRPFRLADFGLESTEALLMVKELA